MSAPAVCRETEPELSLWLVRLAALIPAGAAVAAMLLSRWDPTAIERFAVSHQAMTANEGEFRLDVRSLQQRAGFVAVGYALLSLAMVASAGPVSRWLTLALADARSAIGRWPAALAASRSDAWLIGALTVAVLLGLLVASSTIPMRLDESTSFLHFADRPLAIALGYYGTPNNHILHTLLMKASVGLFGDSPLAIRGPALVAGALLPALAYLAGRQLFDPVVGRVFAVLLPGTAYFLEIAANARGYSIMLAAFLAGIALLPAVQRGSPAAAAGLVVAGVVGAYAVPIMAYPFAILLLWLALIGAVDRGAPWTSGLKGAVAIGSATLVLVAGLYSSVLIGTGFSQSGPIQIIAAGQDMGPEAAPADDTRLAVLQEFLAEAIGQWLFPFPDWAAPAFAVLVCLGVVACFAHSWRGACFVLAATMGAPAVYLLSARAAPPPWSLCFLFVLAILMIACAIVAGCRIALPRRAADRVAQVGALTVSAGLVVGTLASPLPYGVPKAFHFPDGPLAAQAVADLVRDNDVILSREAEYQPMRYNLRRLGAPWRQSRIGANSSQAIPADRGVLVIDRRDSGEPPIEADRLPPALKLVRSAPFRAAILRYYRPDIAPAATQPAPLP